MKRHGFVQPWLSGAKAACSAHGSLFEADTSKSAEADFHELRQDFSPPNHRDGNSA